MIRMQCISSARAAKFDPSDHDALPSVDESLARYFLHEGESPFSSYVHQIVANGCLQMIDVSRISPQWYDTSVLETWRVKHPLGLVQIGTPRANALLREVNNGIDALSHPTLRSSISSQSRLCLTSTMKNSVANISVDQFSIFS
jgi:hypothetical protein